MMLEFLKLDLPWNNLPHTEHICEEIALIKEKSLECPQKYLWTNENTRQPEVQKIFYSIQKLKDVCDKPDYPFIRQQLLEMLNRTAGILTPMTILPKIIIKVCATFTFQ